MLDRFFRRNVYWLLLVSVLLGALVYQSTRPPQVVPASQPFTPEDLSVLDRPVAGEFHQVPLRHVLATLSKEVGRNIHWDISHEEDLLYEDLTSPETPVDFEVKDPIPLWRALDLLCRQVAGANYVVAGSSVILTTDKYLADQYSTTVCYDVRDLLKNHDRLSYYEVRQNLTSKIEATCAPDTWRNVGRMWGEIGECNGRLVIRNTAQAHRQIEDFLAALRK